MAPQVLRRLDEFGRQEPRKNEGHAEAGENDGEDDDEGDVEEELGGEAAGGDFVDVAGLVALGDAFARIGEGCPGIEEARPVFSSAGGGVGDDGADCGVNGVVEGGGKGIDVWIHVAHRTVDDKVVGNALYLVPGEPDASGGIDKPEGGEVGGRGLGEGAGDGGRGRIGTKRHSGVSACETFAFGWDVGTGVEEIGDVLAGELSCEGPEVDSVDGGGPCDVEHPALDANVAWRGT